MYKAAIFDLDGTLLDTLRDLAEAGNHALARQGFEPYPVAAYKTMVGKGIPHLIAQMAKDRPAASQNDLMRSFSAYYAEHMADYTAPYPGVPELLMRLKERGVGVAVLSNKADEYVLPIVGQYFPNLVDRAMGLKERFPPKPDPASALYLMQLLGTDAGNTLYIGDSDVDMLTAKAAGLPGCGVLWGFREEKELRNAGARYIVGSAEELTSLLLNQEAF